MTHTTSTTMIAAFQQATEVVATKGLPIMKIEYRVRPVTRYIVTRAYNADALSDDGGACATQVTERGEFLNEETAYHVAYALCRAEHEASGLGIGSESFMYPKPPAPRSGVEGATTA